MSNILRCPCGREPELCESYGPLNRAEWKLYKCSKIGCKLIRCGSSRNLETALKKWNMAVNKYAKNQEAHND